VKKNEHNRINIYKHNRRPCYLGAWGRPCHYPNTNHLFAPFCLGRGPLIPMQIREFFIYLICHDFQKINGQIKILDKCTSGVVPYGGRLLPPYPTALSPCRRGALRQDSGSCATAGSAAPGPCRRAAQWQVRTVVPHTTTGFF
jgi:hypothetical protein